MKKWHAKTIGDSDVHRDIYGEGNPKPIAQRIMFDAANALVAAHNGGGEEEEVAAVSMSMIGLTKNILVGTKYKIAGEIVSDAVGEEVSRLFHERDELRDSLARTQRLLSTAISKRAFDLLANATPTPQGQSRSETGATHEPFLVNVACEIVSLYESRLPADSSDPITIESVWIKRLAVALRRPRRSETGGTERDEQIARDALNNIYSKLHGAFLPNNKTWFEWRIVEKEILSAITRAHKARDAQSAPAAEQWWYEQIEDTSVFRVHFDAQNFVEVTGRMCAAMIVDAGNKHAAPSSGRDVDFSTPLEMTGCSCT